MARDIDTSPTGDVKYDEKALREAQKRMHAEGSGGRDIDPDDDHEADALKEAADRMGTDVGRKK